MVVALPIKGYIEVVCLNVLPRTCLSLASLLKKHGVDTVAMESTGVYWVSLFEILQDQGFEVCLVNARHVKNVTDAKSDESDAVWIQKLHSLRAIECEFSAGQSGQSIKEHDKAQKKALFRTCSTYLNRMQKALRTDEH